MSWTFHDTDFYVSTEANKLGETTISTDSWFAVSTYGLMRGRPTITPSTDNSNKITLAGRPGEYRSTVKQRSNAQIAIEVLIADAWPHAPLKAIDNPYINNVYERAMFVMSILQDAKRVSYKENGKPANDYYEVISAKCEIQDADEKAAVVKCTYEVFPFRYFLDGNQAVVIPANGSLINQDFNLRPCSEAWPIFVFGPYANSYVTQLRVYCHDESIIASELSNKGNTVTTVSERILTFGPLVTGKTLTIDTGKLQSYINAQTPANKFLSGDYDAVRFEANKLVSIGNNSPVQLKVYSRRGMII